jgi:hypothetical protein
LETKLGWSRASPARTTQGGLIDRHRLTWQRKVRKNALGRLRALGRHGSVPQNQDPCGRLRFWIGPDRESSKSSEGALGTVCQKTCSKYLIIDQLSMIS